MYVLETRKERTKGNTGMNANEFIRAVREETQGNTDIASDIWHMMRQIADHYDECKDCRDAFDDMEYDDETLLELSVRIEQHAILGDWICEE